MSREDDATKKIRYGPTATELARYFHDTHERLAPRFRCEPMEQDPVPWEEVPENNRKLMIATCERVIKWLRTGKK